VEGIAHVATRGIMRCSARSASVATIGPRPTLLIDFLRRYCLMTSCQADQAAPCVPTHAFIGCASGDLARLADLDDVPRSWKRLSRMARRAVVLWTVPAGGRLACLTSMSFSGVVDGLIVVDLLRTEPKVLQKYWAEQAAAFIQYTREHTRTDAAVVSV
jgi:hypothetical protein